MDALARLAPVAAPLLHKVDATLATLGAPPTHPIWRLLGRLGTTPADLVGSVAELQPERLRLTAAALRAHERSYAEATIPAATGWEGQAAGQFAATAAALNEHLAGDGPHSMAGRLRAVAGYVESVAAWQQSLRDSLARALAQVLASHEAATLCLTASALDPQPGDSDDPAVLTAAVAAAAGIGTALLRAAEDAATAGHAVLRAAAPAEELTYRPPAHAPLAQGGQIRFT